MKINIEIGTTRDEVKMVQKEDTASVIGSGLANVFATPAMIALMEKTAFLSIDDLLPDGYSSVGIQINVSHKKASLPGAVINCISKVTKVEGMKVHFNITATDNQGEIGSAEHIRYIINSEDFMKSLNK